MTTKYQNYNNLKMDLLIGHDKIVASLSTLYLTLSGITEF